MKNVCLPLLLISLLFLIGCKDDPYSDVIALPDGEVENITMIRALGPPPSAKKTITKKEDIEIMLEKINGIEVVEKLDYGIGAEPSTIILNYFSGDTYSILLLGSVVQKDNEYYELEFKHERPFSLFDELDYPTEYVDF